MPVPRKPGDWFKYDTTLAVPATTTQEMQRSSQQALLQFRPAGRKEISFLSYSKNEFRFDRLPLAHSRQSPIGSSYARDYVPPALPACKPLSEREVDVPDWLMHRKQRNYLESPVDITTKFMDDWIIDTSEIRKKIDFFRQLKSQTFHYGE